jgi:hypothetical protein
VLRNISPRPAITPVFKKTLKNGGRVMDIKEANPESKGEQKLPYEEPKVLATYDKEELEEAIKPHGSAPSYNGCGCG